MRRWRLGRCNADAGAAADARAGMTEVMLLIYCCMRRGGGGRGGRGTLGLDCAFSGRHHLLVDREKNRSWRGGHTNQPRNVISCDALERCGGVRPQVEFVF